MTVICLKHYNIHLIVYIIHKLTTKLFLMSFYLTNES